MIKLGLTLAFLTSLLLPEHATAAVQPEESGTGVARQQADPSAAAELAEADRLIAVGEQMRAGAVLSRLFESRRSRYDAGTRLAAVRDRQGRHREAARVYQILMAEYPGDRALPLLHAEMLAKSGENEKALQLLEPLARDGKDPRAYVLRGRILTRQGRYLAAREEYEKAKALGGTPELAAERKALDEAINFQHIKSLVSAGGYDLAQPLLTSMSAPGPYSRDARLLSGRVLMAQGHKEAALAHARRLHQEYPGDPEVAALYAEVLIDNGRGAEGERLLARARRSGGGGLANETEELSYRAKENWLKVVGGGFHYSDGSGPESGVGVSVAHSFSESTAALSLSETTRSSRTDPQLALDIDFPDVTQRLSATVNLAVAPGSAFLPRYSAGGELSWDFGAVEASAGWNWFNFREDPADILTAAVTWDIPSSPLALTERVYYAAEQESVLSLTTVSCNPGRRWGVFLSGGFGNASDRRISSEDVKRYDTWLVRAGGEYRLSASYSVGAEGGFESRRGLYDRSGGILYVRYWWP